MCGMSDLSNSPSSAPSTPCPDCADTGFVKKGYNMETSIFCECDAGEDAFEGACDGLAASEMECCDFDPMDGEGDPYWQNDAGEYCCG